jgi:hypothetical protein
MDEHFQDARVESSAKTTDICGVSSVAGTELYIAPEIKKHFTSGTTPKFGNNIVTL